METTGDIFDNYDDYDKLLTLATNRGIKANTKQRALKEIKELDNFIDQHDYHTLTYQGLHRLALKRGLSPVLIPSVQDDTDKNRKILERILNFYDSGVLHKDYLTKEGLMKYRYAKNRNKYFNRVDRTRHVDITFDGNKMVIPPEIELSKYKIQDLQDFLKSFHISFSGLKGREQHLNRVLTIRDILLKIIEDKRSNDITIDDFLKRVPKSYIRFNSPLQHPPQLFNRKDLKEMEIDDLKLWLNNYGYNTEGMKYKEDLIDLILKIQRDFTKTTIERELVPKLDFTLSDIINNALKQPPIPNKYLLKVPSQDYDEYNLFLHIESVSYFIAYGDFFSTTPIEYIMRHKDGNNLADSIIKRYGLDNLLPPKSKFQDKINLLWNFYALRKNTTITVETRQLLRKYNIAQLKRMFPQLNKLDDVTIITLLYLGVKPNEVKEDKIALQALELLSPTDIVKIARYLYFGVRGVPRTNADVPMLSYYQSFLSTTPNSTALILLDWEEGEDPFDLALDIGMYFPSHVRDDKDRINYFLNNLPYYRSVLDRPDVLDPLPYLEYIPKKEIMPIISVYTDSELIHSYELSFDDWFNRFEFLLKIIREAKGEPKWSFKKSYCNNLKRINIEDGDDVNVDDPENPVISYGTLSDYRCYLASELVYSFREDKDNDFSFTVPDWVPDNVNVDYPKPNFREFSLDSIKQLNTLLNHVNYINERRLDELRKQVNKGLIAKSNIGKYFQELRQKYLSFPKDWQEKVQEYLFHLFILTMYMRFWKGPGYPYPTIWIEEGRREDRCGLGARENNTNQQFIVLKKLTDELDKNLRDWLLSFPRFRYDFITGSITMGRETIESIIKDAREGNFCLADVSDQLLGSSYLLILKILNLSNDDFNRHIKRKILNRPDQPDFKPEEVTKTRHTDPFHNLQDV